MSNLPLSGMRIVEFAGIGPGPYAGQLLCDLGAEVIVIDRPKRNPIALENTVDRRGKKSVVVDLKSAEGKSIAHDLIKTADGLIEGNRPSVMERLGLGPDACHEYNPALVYGRMTGWGQSGPYAQMAGHDINYISLTGALYAMGPKDHVPPPPLNLVGDFGGGTMFLVMGMLAALIEAKNTGKGRVVDAAICDGVNSMMGFFHGFHAAGQWTPKRDDNWLDGAAPYYRCYLTKDEKYVAVGCIEAQFLSIMLELLKIDSNVYGNQHDKSLHQRQADLLATKFAEKTRDEWAVIFDGTDACVTPVLDYTEVADHPHMQARNAVSLQGGLIQTGIAPVLSGHENTPSKVMPKDGCDTGAILSELGYVEAKINELRQKGVVHQT